MTRVAQLLDSDPALVNDVLTGAASPLHLCGMAPRAGGAVHARGGAATSNLSSGRLLRATPLQRAATNDCVDAAKALLAAGASLEIPAASTATARPLRRTATSRAPSARIFAFDDHIAAVNRSPPAPRRDAPRRRAAGGPASRARRRPTTATQHHQQSPAPGASRCASVPLSEAERPRTFTGRTPRATNKASRRLDDDQGHALAGLSDAYLGRRCGDVVRGPARIKRHGTRVGPPRRRELRGVGAPQRLVAAERDVR